MHDADKSTDGFRKKTFTLSSFYETTMRLGRALPQLARARRGDRVDDVFAEKIMLSTTAINECQYCTRFHTSLAREAGIDQATIDQILESDVEAPVDDAERPALLFAQRYAEADGNPGPDARAALREAYDPETAADVRAFVHAIYFGNLLGNTYDAARLAIAERARPARRRLDGMLDAVDGVLTHLREKCPV
jgi:AhpD family alkylhydroperoxidase